MEIQKKPPTTKEKIFQAAVELFSKNGYPGVSMQQIADRVGIKKSSIYNHYESKDDILKQIYIRFMEEMIEATPTKEMIKKEMAESTSIVEFWKKRIKKQYEKSASSEAGKLRHVVSMEQYRDKRAGALIIKETERMIEVTAMIFKMMMKKKLIKKDDPLKLATEFEYSNRAMHLEYIILQAFGMDTGEIFQKAINHVDFFISNIRQ